MKFTPGNFLDLMDHMLILSYELSQFRKDLLDNRDWLHKQYIEKGQSQAEISRTCNCAPSTVGRYLRKAGICSACRKHATFEEEQGND